MKSSPKLHISILACLGFVFSFFFAFPPTKALADCQTNHSPYNNISCVSANRTTVYCETTAECTTFKTSLGATAAVTTTTKQYQTVFPDKGCKDGIMTALGCLPYKMESFGPTIFGFLVGFAGMIALFLMLFASFLYLSSGGDHEQLKKAKELFTAAITGLLFIVFSVVLLRITAGDILKVPGF